MSPVDRPRFNGLGGGRGKNVKPISGKGSLGKVNLGDVVLCIGIINSKSGVGVSPDDACSCIILRCQASCVACTWKVG
jgi:hypothetical protein